MMPSNYSPLRYPGGKTQLYPFVKNIIECNNMLGETYVEPFAGGAGLAIKLLLKNDVTRIIINDYDYAIYSIWYCILNYTDDFCKKIAEVDISVAEWDKQKAIYNSITDSIFDLGFAAFYLNRTNRSGIIKGGIIGGREQLGNYKINARFNKVDLINKIKEIALYRKRIILTHMDALNLLKSGFLNHYYKIFINFDPPYVIKGSKLYKNSFSEQDHKILSELISCCKRKWIVTYDICPLVEKLYCKFRSTEVNINYSANNSRKTKEYVFFSNNLIIPNEI